MPPICDQCQWCEKHVGNVNLFGNAGLLIVKLIGGVLGRSQALIADALHSVSDLIISVFLVAGLHVSKVPPDEEHRWGHGQVEFIVSTVIAVLLLFCGVLIISGAVMSIYQGASPSPGILAVWAALISVVFNEVLFRHSICIGKQMNSPSVIANAWENRADAYTSIAALIGVFGARMGYWISDPIAAICVSIFIMRSGIITLLEAVHGIMDGSVEAGFIDEVRLRIEKEPSVKDIIRLRVRRIGQKNAIDAEVAFDPEMKVSEVRGAICKMCKSITSEVERIGYLQIIPRSATIAPEDFLPIKPKKIITRKP